MTRFLPIPARILLAVACLMSVPASRSSAETLREVVARSRISPEALANRDTEISSYAVLDTPRWFAVAYYVEGNADSLQGPLWLDRYDRSSRQWRSVSLSRDQTAAGGSDCLGSAVEFAAAADSFRLTTHLSPSAACVLLLSTDLQLRATLYGWPLATLADGSIVYHRSQIHFAPVHAAEIAVYNRKTGRSYTIYPSKPYQAVRQAEIAKLTEFFDAHLDWCNQHNHPCDPEWFDNSLDGAVVTEGQTDSLAFVIDYGTDPDDPAAPPVTAGHRKVVYVFRYVSNEFGFQYREIPQSDVTARFGAIPLGQLFTPGRLQQIFTK